MISYCYSFGQNHQNPWQLPPVDPLSIERGLLGGRSCCLQPTNWTGGRACPKTNPKTKSSALDGNSNLVEKILPMVRAGWGPVRSGGKALPASIPDWLGFQFQSIPVFPLVIGEFSGSRGAGAAPWGRPLRAVQRPPSSVRRPASAVQRPPSSVRRPASAVQRPP